VIEGFAKLSYYELKASIIAFLIALLAFFGLLPRMQEYR
jgi:phage shock protein PspC (stress-responsive transcriptional regulator)